MKVHKAKSVREAIENFQEFLECDMYTKFRPAQTLPIGKKGKDETWYRQDVFKSERDFIRYLEDHFNIMKKEIIRLIGKQYKNEKTKTKNK